MGEDGKYGKITTERGGISEGEPCFILRGQDIFAAHVVRIYAALRRSAGDDNGADQCEGIARVMQKWTKKKLPD